MSEPTEAAEMNDYGLGDLVQTNPLIKPQRLISFLIQALDSNGFFC